MTQRSKSASGSRSTPPAQVVKLADIPPVPCPCGQARRAFAGDGNSVATLHQVDISRDSRTHYHERLTEIYYVLEGRGYIELDGERHPIEAGTAVFIPPGTRHRAVGELRILNVVSPPFDPADEHFDGVDESESKTQCDGSGSDMQ